MDPFQNDSSMLDMSNFNSEMMANMMGMDMSQYGDDIQMDLGDVSAVPYNSIEPMSGSIAESDIQITQNNDDNGNISNIGAGPLPTGFGAQSNNAGSTLTEFTKRRNWSQRVIEEIKDFLYILTPDARFLYVSPSSKLLTGYEPSELTGRFIQEYIHPDDSSLFLREFNESIATGHTLRLYHRFQRRPSAQAPNTQINPAGQSASKYTILEVHGHPHLTSDVSHLELSGGPRNNAGFCAGFFMMARPYPTKSAVLLDSFLEHKLENERLQNRIATLKREEAEEIESNSTTFHKRPHNASQTASYLDGTPNTINFNRTDTDPDISTSDRQSSAVDQYGQGSMPPPAKPTLSNQALTHQALEAANTFTRPDSITDKMARYEGSSHVDSIEMLTGLDYRAGERAINISTGGASPALIRGDAGISIPSDKQGGNGSAYGGLWGADVKKPKKVKSADEYVCTDCGTLDSPEWRKGPSGPKTLCNACGLRWAKKEKKRTGSAGNTGLTGSSLSSATVTPSHNAMNAGTSQPAGKNMGSTSAAAGVPGLKHDPGGMS